MLIEETPYVDVMQDWFKRIGYDAPLYRDHAPVRPNGPVKRLTKRERQRVDSLSGERGYRRFEVFRRCV